MKKITWYINAFGDVLIWEGHHNIDSMDSEGLKKFSEKTIQVVPWKESKYLFSSLGYEPEYTEDNKEIYFHCDEWGTWEDKALEEKKIMVKEYVHDVCNMNEDIMTYEDVSIILDEFYYLSNEDRNELKKYIHTVLENFYNV